MTMMLQFELVYILLVTAGTLFNCYVETTDLIIHKNRIVKILGDFNGKEVSSSGDDFAFTWLADVPPGQYYVEAAELEEEDEDEDSDDGEDDEDDDRNISYNFQIVAWPYAAPMYSRYQKK